MSEFSGKKWTNYVESMIQKWEEFHMYFFDHYNPKQIHLLRYENLKTDLILELRKLMNFLGVQMENDDCVFKSQEGSAKRNKPDNILAKIRRNFIKLLCIKFMKNWDFLSKIEIHT